MFTVFLFQTRVVTKLSMYAGVLSLGIGDSIAAVSGTLIGRTKWPGTPEYINNCCIA